MRRSLAFALACAVLLAAPGALAQKPQRVGVLVGAVTPQVEVFRDTLKKLGYTEGSNVVLDVRVAADRLDKLSAMASEIVKASPDVILAVNTPGTEAAMAATRTIPIVMVAVGDPIGSGFVSSLARPDKNVTGMSNLCGELAGKRLALFKDALPGAKRFAVIFNSGDPITAPQLRDVERTAPALGVEARIFAVRTRQEVDASLAAMLDWKADGIVWLCGQQRALTRYMLPMAAKHRLPVMVALGLEVPGGGLISYAADTAELYRRAAAYVDKILKGARVGDLPVEQPTKFELVVNLKVAAALGITVPQSVLVRADSVVQ